MCCDCVVQVLIKYNMSSSVAPTSYVNSYTDCRWMTCCILDVNAHYRIFSTHTLWSKADCIDSVFKKSLHLGCSFDLPLAVFLAYFGIKNALLLTPKVNNKHFLFIICKHIIPAPHNMIIHRPLCFLLIMSLDCSPYPFMFFNRHFRIIFF